MALWSRMLTLCLLCIANAVAAQNVSAQSTAAAAAIAENSHREAGTKPAADSSGSAEKPEVSLNQLINDNTASDKQTTLAPPSNNAAVAGNTTGNVSSPHIGDSPSAPVAADNAGLSITVASVAMVTGSANGSESVTRPPPRPVVPTSSSPVSSSQPAAAPPAPVDTAPITSNNASSSEETDDVLPEAGAAEEEHLNSMSIFLVLAIIGLCILMIHFMISSKLRFLPESVAVVFLGALVGLVLKILSKSNIAHWQREEAFSPTVFFLVILPPIIFESGYNLHKGNFFQNFGTILLFAVFGTTISALVVGGGVYVLGMADVAYRLSFVESFAFGSLISAVDPVATLAIFNALDIDPVLSMLVFGESILNDAVAIVLTTTALESGMSPSTAAPVGDVSSGGGGVVAAVMRFCVVFGASAALGTVSALLAALLFKHVQLRSNPSLEFAMMLIFIYAPYGLAEGVHLSEFLHLLLFILRSVFAICTCAIMSSSGRLTDEQLQKIRTYRPDPLTPLTPDHSPALRPLIVDGKLGKFVSVDDVSLLNAASHNYLGLVEHTEVQEAGLRCIDKYGIGACGPRTFFGTVDVHLALEHAISAFLGTQETAIYSLGFSTISSVIPAYVKSSDVLFVDEMVNFSIQCGVQAARCSVHWFKHNDSDHLTHCIAADDEHHGVEALSTNVRRFLVLEGIYQRCGSLARLDQLLTVARRHRVRVILDESISLGVLGRRGRGALEHYQLKTDDVDIICGSLEHAIGSYGGFSSGTHYVIDHQRLNGLGYVFSASLPPMLAASALRALEIIDNDVTMTSRLSSVCRQLHAALHALPGLSVCGDELSPVKFLRLCTSSSSSSSDMSEQDERTLRQIVDQARSEGVLVCVAARVVHQEAINLPPSIRVTAAVHMLPQDINLIHSALSNGIMAILFCGVVMSHYTHFNLSPVTQITMQQTMRSLAFVAETCVFAYLGLAIFSFRHAFEPALVFWSLTLCLVGRALNIFPLSWLANHFREHKITTNMQFIMWFSGLRGAIAYALCLHLEFASTTRHVLVTNTLIIILTTILVLGGATKPLLHYLQADKFTNARGRRGRVQRPRRRQRSCRRSSDDFNLSKTHELGTAIDSEYFSEMTEEDEQQDLVGDRQLRDAPMGDRQLRDAPMGDNQLRDAPMGDRQLRDGAAGDRQLRGFARLDFFYLQPFFTRRLTQNEMRAAQLQMSAITDRAYQDIRVSPCDHPDPQDAVIGSDLDQDQSCDDSDQRRLLV